MNTNYLDPWSTMAQHASRSRKICPVDGKHPIVMTFTEGPTFLQMDFHPTADSGGGQLYVGEDNSGYQHRYDVCAVGHVTVNDLGDDQAARTNVIRVVGDTAMGKSYLLSELSVGPPPVGAVEEVLIFRQGKTLVSRRASFSYAQRSLAELQQASRSRLAPTELHGDGAVAKLGEHLLAKIDEIDQMNDRLEPPVTALIETFDELWRTYFTKKHNTMYGRSPSLVLYSCQHPGGVEARPARWTGVTYLCDMPGEDSHGALGFARMQEQANELRHADAVAYLVDAADLETVRQGLPEQFTDDLIRARRLSANAAAHVQHDLNNSRRAYYEVLTNYLSPENHNMAQRCERVIVVSKSDLIWAVMATTPEVLLPGGQPSERAVQTAARYLFRYARMVRDGVVTCSDLAKSLMFSELEHATLDQELSYLEAVCKAVMCHYYQADHFLNFITNATTQSFSFQVRPGGSAFSQEILVPAETWLDYVCRVGEFSLQVRDVMSAILVVPMLHRILGQPAYLVEQLDAGGYPVTFAFATVPVKTEDGIPDNAWDWPGLSDRVDQSPTNGTDLRPDSALWAKLNFKHFAPPHWMWQQ